MNAVLDYPVEIEPQIEPLFEKRHCSFCPEALHYVVLPDEDEGEALELAIEREEWGTIGRELACDRCLKARD